MSIILRIFLCKKFLNLLKVILEKTVEHNIFDF